MYQLLHLRLIFFFLISIEQVGSVTIHRDARIRFSIGDYTFEHRMRLGGDRKLGLFYAIGSCSSLDAVAAGSGLQQRTVWSSWAHSLSTRVSRMRSS